MKRRVGDTPAPVDKEERIIQLYFVRNWQVRNICDRYRMSKPLVQKILTEWRIRAVAGGYVQDIDPESLDLLIRMCEARQQETRLPEIGTAKNKLVGRLVRETPRLIAEDDSEITLPESVWELFASVKSDSRGSRSRHIANEASLYVDRTGSTRAEFQIYPPDSR